MKISQFLPKGVGVLFPEKPYLKLNTPPLPVKKSNPARRGQADNFLASFSGIVVRALGARVGGGHPTATRK